METFGLVFDTSGRVTIEVRRDVISTDLDDLFEVGVTIVSGSHWKS